MKNKLQTVLICLFAGLAFAVGNSPARAACPMTYWTGTVNSDWFNPSNWNPCQPDSSTDVFINNGGKVAINSSGAATVQSLTLGASAGDSGTLVVNGGRLDIPGSCFEGLGMTSPGLISVGYGGTGTLEIKNGGSVNCGFAFIAAFNGGELVSGSNGAVTVDGATSYWSIGSEQCTARLFIGGNGIDPGGIALLNVTNGGTVAVATAEASLQVVKVGISGTLTGNGTLRASNESGAARTTVQGTLAPSNGTLSYYGNLTLIGSNATTTCNVTPSGADNVAVHPFTGSSGTASLAGRLSVNMTGTFTPGTTFTLLHADGGLGVPHTTFGTYSITYPLCYGFTPVITYDYVANNVNLYLRPGPPPCQ